MTARSAKPKDAAPLPQAELESVLDHRFRDPALLELALTHRSLAFEAETASTDVEHDNERLEFLGDAVLGLAVAEALYARFPQAREGELTRLRAALVSRKSLSETAARLGLGRYLLLGKGEEQSGGRRKPALLANTLEAVIAALYLDAGAETAARFIAERLVTPALPQLASALESGGVLRGGIGDHKSALQERMQARGTGQPRYVLTGESGPDHCKLFRVEVYSSGGSVALAAAEGPTKREAQQAAAALALERMQAEEDGSEEAAASEDAGG